MGNAERCVVVAAVLLTCGCGVLDAGGQGGGVDGYVLRRDAMQEGPSAGVMFVQYVEGGSGQITGRMHTAYPAPTEDGMPSVQFDSHNMTGTLSGTDVMMRQEQFAPGAVGDVVTVDFSGTVEGDEMRLTTNVQGILTVWEGETGTLEDFGAAAQELAEENQ